MSSFKFLGKDLALPIIYSLSGIFFTFFGAFSYWSLYPLGPVASILITELTVHIVRYFVFQHLIFTSSRGFVVNLKRYVLAVLPASFAAFISAILFSSMLGRFGSTVSVVFLSFVVGFFWGKKVFSYK